ncbi:MAG: hypothetical protein U5K33_10285 [Halofilum sp. (in: g-proteobacteria)]|nr:hypothetical protein [Halofilum sp. (in: g-proteobacteria)]
MKRLIKWLRTLATRGVEIGGIDSGSELLQQAGFLNGFRSAQIHWQDMAVMLARYPPDRRFDNHMYEIDRDRLTSGGGVAAMDMMLEVIRRHEREPCSRPQRPTSSSTSACATVATASASL